MIGHPVLRAHNLSLWCVGNFHQVLVQAGWGLLRLFVLSSSNAEGIPDIYPLNFRGTCDHACISSNNNNNVEIYGQ